MGKPENNTTFGALRSLLKKNYYIWMLCKGLKSWKQNGLRHTLGIAKYKLYASKLRESYSEQQLKQQRQTVFPKEIKFSILVPLYNTPEAFLHEMIRSVLNQTYENWELCMADGSDAEHPGVRKICAGYAETDGRIRYRKLEENLGISENTNACIEMAAGDYLSLLDHDDLLHPAALYEVMRAICEQGADFIYTDEATFKSPDINKIVSVHFKPDFAVDNLRANNYICHFSTFARTVLDQSGYFRTAYNGSQDHDMILRLTAKAENIVHIPRVLYYWRSHPQSVAMDIASKEYAVRAGQAAVKDHVSACGYAAEVESNPFFPTIYRLKYELKARPKVSILISVKNRLNALQRCISSVLSLTTYADYEIVIVDTGSDDLKIFDYYDRLKEDIRVKIVSPGAESNDSRINNLAAQQAAGEYYIFLHSDTEVITPEWIEEMLMYVQREDVGAAGAMLYYPNNRIQHAGMILGFGEDHIAGYAFRGFARNSTGYMWRLKYAQNMSAVTGACIMVKASVYRQLGGMDEIGRAHV